LRSGLHRCDQRPDARDRDGALEILDQHLEAHLAGDVLEPSGLEVAGAHPGLYRPEDVFYGLSPDAHGAGLTVQPPLYGNVASYAYDAAGKLTSRGGTLFQSVLPTALTTATYDADNRLTAWTTSGGTTSPTYDANGSMVGDGTRTFAWDSRNRLTAISGTTAAFAYDWTGRRSSTTLGGVTTTYLYDGEDIVQEQTGGSAGWSSDQFAHDFT